MLMWKCLLNGLKPFCQIVSAFVMALKKRNNDFANFVKTFADLLQANTFVFLSYEIQQ